MKGRFGESTQLLHLTLMVETLMTVERQKMGALHSGERAGGRKTGSEMSNNIIKVTKLINGELGFQPSLF